MNYDAPTPETDAFMLLIDDSGVDLGQVEAKLKDMECERNSAVAALRECADFGIYHHADCPEDDTCKCDHIRAVNAILSAITPRAPLKPTAQVSVEEIYQAYPLKVGKPKALAAIKAALKTIEAPRLLELTRAFSRVRPPGTPFTPHPATWFNQQRYNDDPSTWNPHATNHQSPAKGHRNDFIAGAGQGPSTSEILRRRAEREAAERAAATGQPVAAEVAGAGGDPPQGPGGR